ncbi:hypothetical protein BME96_08330 [Virgibacillus halodenitrificans]|uniref:Endolytic murein transglycosylase n=1 Tax=Virgibacillus halodenitrificans TaxID=1482 RepID=A0AAC9IYE4_VIRHA|nr:endolytic transglycosylase MltG [Virgibacillus halodenitrificans]APC48181.1 hypothetical protein BME96_08330 [Virgibacillus halodenitrificans]
MSDKEKQDDFKENLAVRSEEARTVRKIVAIIIISLLLIIIIGGVSGYLFIKSALEPVNPESDKNIEVEIPIGSSTSTIASILEDKGIIKDSRVFRFYIKFKNEADFQAGDYTFSPAMSIDEIIKSLKKGKVMADPLYTVTIPEGKTIEEMAVIYSEKLPFTKKEFMEKVNNIDYIEGLMNKYPSVLKKDILDPEIRTPLEGYLFAATYDFYEKDPKVEVVIENMLKKTESILSKYLDEITASDYTVHETLTFASLVEKEASTKEQRKEIASVFVNRLKEGMKLQTDPTVLYALGKHKDRVLFEDLKVESPYNTYHISGLPVGPIGNFSESSLKAVINPIESEYLYFLHDGEGNIYYSKTLDEHKQYRKKYID